MNDVLYEKALDAYPGQEIELQRYEVEFELIPVALEMK